MCPLCVCLSISSFACQDVYLTMRAHALQWMKVALPWRSSFASRCTTTFLYTSPCRLRVVSVLRICTAALSTRPSARFRRLVCTDDAEPDKKKNETRRMRQRGRSEMTGKTTTRQQRCDGNRYTARPRKKSPAELIAVAAADPICTHIYVYTYLPLRTCERASVKRRRERSHAGTACKALWLVSSRAARHHFLCSLPSPS